MWIDIKGSFYNLNHYHKIVKFIDECESYKDYCIKLYLKNGTKTEYKLISFQNKELRDEAFLKLYKLIEIQIL
jgi:uncharacterized protein YxeA